MSRRAIVAIATAAALYGVACARPETPTHAPAAALRVGTTLDYAPFSFGADPDAAEGFDLELVRRFARERGLALELVPVTWTGLLPALSTGGFDVVLGGVTMRPDRSLAGRFSAPLAETGAMVLVPAASGLRDTGDLERPGLRLAVNAGGHLERVARVRFPRAALSPIPDNAAVPARLARGEVDAVLTDSAEAPRWQRALPPTRAIGPLTRDRKAWLLAADRTDLARTLDDWLAAREADGTLAAARKHWLGAGGAETASPLAALLAAIDERLALMPFVADAKLRAGLPVTDPAQEARVLAAARGGVAAAAREHGRAAPPEGAVDALFRALIDAASEIQAAHRAAGAPAPATGPDLARDLRPAIARISQRVARALVTLEPPSDPAALRASVGEALRSAVLTPATLDRISAALAACAARGSAVAN